MTSRGSCLIQNTGRTKMMAITEKTMPAMVPMAKSNQKTSSGPAVASVKHERRFIHRCGEGGEGKIIWTGGYK